MCIETHFSYLYNNDPSVLAYIPVNGYRHIVVKENGDVDQCDFYLEDVDGKLQQLSPHDVIGPKEMCSILPSKMRRFLQLTRFRLATLNDGSHKLYINLQLCGGMLKIDLQKYTKENPEVSNAELVTKLKEYIPANTYTYISVRPKLHSFLCEPKVPTRVFTFSPSGNCVTHFLVGVKRFLFGFSHKEFHTYNTSAVAEFLLGKPNKAGEVEITKAFKERRAIYLFLSQDGKDFEARMEQEQDGKCSIS